MTAYTRLSVNITAETETALRARQARGVTATETIRRAVALLDLFDREQQAGGRIRFVGPDRELVRLDAAVAP